MADVQLPQLGESVAEGVITQWLVEVGDEVAVDQPIVEISTDKVDTEVPSPVAGTVTDIRFAVDDTVEVGQVIAVIGEAGTSNDGDAGADASEEEAPAPAPSAPADDEPRERPRAAQADPEPTSSAPGGGRRVQASPLVRRLLREAGIEPADVSGTGPAGRVTRADAEQAIATKDQAPSAAPATAAAPAAAYPAPAPTAPSTRERPAASPFQVDFGGETSVTQDLSRIRRIIARSMMESLQTTAQLTAAVEADVTAIMNLRSAVKDSFRAREGASLTPLAIIARAVCMTLPRHPALNSSIDQEAGTATFHRNVNLGFAVDTERGLLVPNVKNAQDLTVPGMARAIGDIASKARSQKLGPDEISGGTFTITNTGSMGTLFDTPVLNPPEVAILATPAIEKRPVVISDGLSDSIAIRWMTYLCLTYDHRMVDGADAARFLQDLKFVLETHDFAAELGG